MVSVEEAIDIVLRQVRPLTPVRVSFADALGLVLAEDVHAAEPMPPFRAAAVDGYAVIAADPSPIRRLAGEQSAGYIGNVQVTPGTAVRVTTTAAGRSSGYPRPVTPGS